MSKWAISGLLFVIVGGLLIFFQKLSSLMGNNGEWDTLCLVDLFDPKYFNWIDSMTFLGLNNLLDTIVLAPLYILLLCIGAVLLIISGFKKN